MNDRGYLISELRREAGYTQKTLADALGITDKAVSKWERGICLPDVSLLPKLSALLDADIELLLSQKKKEENQIWVGLLDFAGCDFDISQIVYDKPAVYYILSHYLLLGITEIYVRGNENNLEFLKSQIFADLGFRFVFDFSELPKEDMMIMNRPYFLFGSDLTRLFKGAMLSETLAKANPMNAPTPFLFCPSEYAFMYLKNPSYMYEIAAERTFGRGMICIEMGSADAMSDVASFIRMYQNNTKLLIGSLEEIAYRKEIITQDKLMELIEGKPYGKMLIRSLKVERNAFGTQSKPEVG